MASEMSGTKIAISLIKKAMIMKYVTGFLSRFLSSAFLCIVALNGYSNSYPDIDSDNDGYVDWFEFDVIKNGQVDPEWDYGMAGLINTYESLDSYVLHEASPSRINFCQTDQSNRFQELVSASSSVLQVEGDQEVFSNSNICDQQRIITITESVLAGSSEPDEGFVKAKLYGIYSSEEFNSDDSAFEAGYQYSHGAKFNENKLILSSSIFFDFSGVSELYLDVEIRSKFIPDPEFNYDKLLGFDNSVGFEVEFSTFSFENIAAFYAWIPDDTRCEGSNYRTLDIPFDPSICGIKKIRIPLNSVLRNGVPRSGGKYKNNVSVFNTISIGIDRWNVQRFCEYNADCQNLAVEYEIKNIKIVGGDRFPHDPEEYLDTDNDGLGGNSDPDNDNDGVQNELDAFPFDSDASSDLDGDGVANFYDIDMDGDGVPGFGVFKPFSANPEYGYFGTEIATGLYLQIVEESGLEIYDIQAVAQALPGLSHDNPLMMTTVHGGEFFWYGGNEFSGDTDDDSDGYAGELDKFPKNPLAWADIDNDCVPDNIDNIDNNLNSIPDTDCDGLNDSVDTDDDNDTVPDNLIIPIINDGIPTELWQYGITIKDERDDDLCVIDNFVTNSPSDCGTEALYIAENNNLGSGMVKIVVPEKSESGQVIEVEFNSITSINIQSFDPGACGLPVGYLELETRIEGANGNEKIGFSISTSKNEMSEVLPNNFKEYWPLIYSGQWVPLKIPLYEFFNSLVVTQSEFERPYYDLNINDKLSSINRLTIHSQRQENAYSIYIKNIRFIVRDEYPLSDAPAWCNFPGLSISSIDFDNDGFLETFDEPDHPFSLDVNRVIYAEENATEEYVDSRNMTWDFDGSGHADALTDGLLLLRYGFDLHGENLVQDAKHPSSSMTASEVEARLENSADIIDIDMNGEFSALTDGLILLRYLFDLTGQNLIADATSTSANRVSAAEITSYIQLHMP
jgi:hypothetical protein